MYSSNVFALKELHLIEHVCFCPCCLPLHETLEVKFSIQMLYLFLFILCEFTQKSC